MLSFALAGMLIGAALGLRATVLALLPAMACALVIAGASALAGDRAFGPTMIALALLLTCLQIGYLGGAVLRFSLDRSLVPGRMQRPPAERPLPRVHSR